MPMKQFAAFEAHNGWVTALGFAPDGALFSGGWDHLVKRWDASSGALLNTFSGHSQVVDALQVSPDGSMLLTASVDKTVRAWDIGSGRATHTLDGHRGTVAALSIAPDGRSAASGSYDRTIRIWDLSNGTVSAVLKGHKNNVVALAISPDGRLLASGGVADELRLWSLADLAPLGKFAAHERAIASLRFLPDSHSLVSTGADDTLRIWDTTGFRQTMQVQLGAGGTHALAISPGERLAAITCDRALKVIDLQHGAIVETLAIPVKGVYGVSFSPDGSLLAASSTDKMVRVWETNA